MSPFILVKKFNDPEVEAMLQALYSRSHTSIVKHLEELGIPLDENDSSINKEKEAQIKQNLNKYYIGYGHSSIGDCGSVTIFIENVSIIAAKAIQNTPLYNGQESSTRYIDFNNKKDGLKNLLLSLYKTENSMNKELENKFESELNQIIEDYYDLYFTVRQTVYNGVIKDTTNSSAKAYSFDVARGFLPSGTLTQLSFHGTLRTIREHFKSLLSHGLTEVSEIAKLVLTQLHEKYPSTFEELVPNKVKSIIDTYYGNEGLYITVTSLLEAKKSIFKPIWEVDIPQTFYTAMHKGYLKEIKYPSSQHNESSLLGNITIISEPRADSLDYGSWRDLQRHRNGFCNATLPYFSCFSNLIVTDWYLDRIKEINSEESELLLIAIDLFGKQLNKFIQFVMDNDKYIDNSIISYLTPLGYPVDVLLSYNANELDYILNLRLQETVHGSLVNWLLDNLDIINTKFSINGTFLEKYKERMYLRDKTYSVKRGKQDITLNGESISAL